MTQPSREARLVFQAWDDSYVCTECEKPAFWWMYEYKGLRYCNNCTRKWWPHLHRLLETPGRKPPLGMSVRSINLGNRYLLIWYLTPTG